MSDATDPLGDTLRHLTPDDHRLLESRARPTKFSRGQFVLTEGAVGHDLFLIRSGYVHVERTENGAGIALARFGPGQVFGEMAFVEETVGAASVIADENVEIDVFDQAELRDLLAADVGFAARFYRSLAAGLAHRLRVTSLELIERSMAPKPVVKTALLSERQLPQGLFEAIMSFKKDVTALARDLRTGVAAGDAAQDRGSALCDGLCAAVAEFTEPAKLLEIAADDPFALREISEVAAGIGGYVVRETFSLLMQSATLAHAYGKPHGYAEDWEMVERIYRDEAEGDGQLGGIIDRWFLNRSLCRARRRVRKSMPDMLLDIVKATSGPEPLRIACLACGTSPELIDFMDRTAGLAMATCIDSEPDALRAAATAARGQAERISFMHADVLTLLRQPGWLTLAPQRIVYALNWSDYLSDHEVGRFLDWSYDHLEPGGTLLATNTEANDLDVRVFDLLLDWPRFARTEAQWRKLIEASRFPSAEATIVTDTADASLLVRCRR